MRKIFNHLFPDTVWSIGYWGSQASPNLWIETRSGEKKAWHRISFTDWSLENIPSSDSHSLQWLVGLEDAGVFFQLRQGKNPGIERLMCYNLPSGSLRYSIEINQWTSLDGTYLRCPQGILDLKTGKFSQDSGQIQSIGEIESPLHFEENQDEFKAFATLFEQKFKEKIGKGLDYWEGSDKLIFSYYIYENAWKNKLRICDYDFQTLFIETIAEGDQIGYQTFQRFRNSLIFIKEKRELVIYADH